MQYFRYKERFGLWPKNMATADSKERFHLATSYRRANFNRQNKSNFQKIYNCNQYQDA